MLFTLEVVDPEVVWGKVGVITKDGAEQIEEKTAQYACCRYLEFLVLRRVTCVANSHKYFL